MQKGRILLLFLFVSTFLFLLLFLTAKTYVFSEKRTQHIQSNLETPVPLTPTKTPVPTPTKTPSPTPTPTPSPIPTPTKKPLPTRAPIQTNFSGGMSDLLSQVNDYRKSQGLSPVVSNSDTCSFARLRAQEISADFSHAGFTNRVNNHTLPYSYHEVTENIAMNSNSNDVVSEWIKSPGHAENMRKNTPYVCIEKYGEYYVYEGLRP